MSGQDGGEIPDPGEWRAYSWHRKPELVVLVRSQAQLLRDMASYLDGLADRGESSIATRGAPSMGIMRLEANRVASAIQLGCFGRTVARFKSRQGGQINEEPEHLCTRTRGRAKVAGRVMAKE